MDLSEELLEVLQECEQEEDVVEVADRETILSIQDPAEIGPDEYLVFFDYAKANIYNILTSRVKTKIPDRITVEEMAKDAISLAIATYDIEKAREKNATFRTHLGWKAMQVVTDFARAFKKAGLNELNTADEEFKRSLEDNKIQTDIYSEKIDSENIETNEFHDTDKIAF